MSPAPQSHWTLRFSLQSVSLLLIIFGGLYAFHKKVIVSDLQASMYTRAEGVKLEIEVEGLKKAFREDLKEMRQDIKELLKRK